MKRDMEIIRQILLNVESDKYQYGQRVTLDGVSEEVCAHHVALMQDAGLVDARIISTSASPCASAMIHRLSSAGYDFLDAIRQDTIWNKAKEHVIKPGASFGLSILIEWVKNEVRRRVLGDKTP